MDPLRQSGYEVHGVALPSVGSTNASVGLPDDAAALRAELERLADEKGEDIIMVVHSYGGMVGSNAVEGLGRRTRHAQGKKGGVVMLVYMCALAVDVGVSVLGSVGGVSPPWVRVQGDFLYPVEPEKIFYADVPADLTQKAVAALRSKTARSYDDMATYAPWADGVEVGYFFTEQDQAVPREAQTQFAANMPSHVVEAVKLAAEHGMSKNPV
ncbi:hypothetical protein PG995_010784 [Apiospora arundinis]